jgi:hypothetical protein
VAWKDHPSFERQKVIDDFGAFATLSIVDWNRLNGSGTSPFHAMRTVESWLAFADAPDFHGRLIMPEAGCDKGFWGDIGRV